SEEGWNRSRGSEASAFGAGFPLLRGNGKKSRANSGAQPDPPAEAPAPRAMLLFSELTKQRAFRKVAPRT
ncbi:hypothetical protein, partial [Paenibacillus pabuli]|uniref:hypothetical protein n=1 Tax=Paenibacillus pabuli TaxID=1472 RepID=UPI002DBC3215